MFNRGHFLRIVADEEIAANYVKLLGIVINTEINRRNIYWRIYHQLHYL